MIIDVKIRIDCSSAVAAGYNSRTLVFLVSTAQSKSWSHDVRPGLFPQRQGVCWLFQGQESVSINQIVDFLCEMSYYL